MPKFVQKAQRGETIRRLVFRFHFRREMAQTVAFCDFTLTHYLFRFRVEKLWERLFYYKIDIILFLSITIYNEQKKKQIKLIQSLRKDYRRGTNRSAPKSEIELTSVFSRQFKIFDFLTRKNSFFSRGTLQQQKLIATMYTKHRD